MVWKLAVVVLVFGRTLQGLLQVAGGLIALDAHVLDLSGLEVLIERAIGQVQALEEPAPGENTPKTCNTRSQTIMKSSQRQRHPLPNGS